MKYQQFYQHSQPPSLYQRGAIRNINNFTENTSLMHTMQAVNN